MSLRAAWSFDHIATADLTALFSTIGQHQTVHSTGGRRNGGYVSMGANAYLLKVFDNQPTWIIGGAYRHHEYPPINRIIFAVVDGTSLQCELRWGPDGNIRITRDWTVIATGPVLPLNQWYYIEFKVTISDTGTYEVRKDGVTILSGSGDTQNTANAYGNRIRLGTGYIGSYDDVYVCDGAGTRNNDFLGDCKVEARFPNANGTNQDWTPSSGSDHYTLIDDTTPNGDTDYLYSGTAGHLETNNFQDISLIGSIKGVVLRASVRKDDAGSRMAAAVCRSGGTNYEGPAVSITDTYAYTIERVYETDPATGLAWTPTSFNAAEFGIKLVS